MKKDCSHHHTHNLEESSKDEKKAFYWALWIVLFFMVLEIVGGFYANSLALISDALHMFVDAGALIIALFVSYLIHRPATQKKSYGYHRAEILGALANGIILWVLIGFLIYEAIERLFNPPEVDGSIVFLIAFIGLIANFFMIKILHPGNKGSLNLKASYIHVLGDLLTSVGVIISGILIWVTKWNPIDPICTILFSCFILFSSGKLIKQALDILMESTPNSIDPNLVYKDLLSLESVEEVHDLHIWNISSKIIALSVHIISEMSEKSILKEAHDLLQKKYQINHTTIQVEKKDEFIHNNCFDCNKNILKDLSP
jgi:cobalt-zinc-cadmium efflux system protein